MTEKADIPARLSINQLAAMWKLTQPRISQFLRDGKIKRGSDGLIDRDEALAFRKMQVSKHEANVLFQNHRGQGPKITEYLDAKPLSVDDILYGEADEEETSDPVREAIKKSASLNEMRTRAEALRVERAERRDAKEAGELMPRVQVYKDMHGVGATIQRQLRTLEHELPVIFADRDVRPQIREKVRDVIDRCLHSMAKKLAKYGDDDAATSTPPVSEDD